jgi:hypothetical protein
MATKTGRFVTIRQLVHHNQGRLAVLAAYDMGRRVGRRQPRRLTPAVFAPVVYAQKAA